MKMTITSTFFALALLSASAAQAASIETVAIGNAGNANDTHVFILTTYGGVAYDYRIGKTEVTNAQYVDFLNSVAATDTHDLYNTSMGNTTQGGITRSGSSGNWSYSVKADSVGNGPGGSDYTYGNKPVNYVSWYDAARFANWMHNGMGTGDTGKGAYTMSESLPTRSTGAKWFLPTEDEWYKAAYYDPNHGGTNVGGYWDYATGTDTVPDNNLPSGDTSNSANYLSEANGITTGDGNYPLTDAGAYGSSDSAYGTYDQNGNVSEWNEAIIFPSRGLRGGGWNSLSSDLSTSNRRWWRPTGEHKRLGFRVASVPEPSSIALLVSGLGTLLLRRRRKK